MYKVVKILDKEFLDELVWMYDNNLLATQPAGVVGRDRNGRFNTVDRSQRSTTRITTSDPRLYPELCEPLERYVDDGTKVHQFDFLIYEVGDHFAKHQDVIKGGTERYWSTITLLDRTDDLEGGELNIYNGDSKETVTFDVGETVVFRSNLFHEVLPVTKGVRKVLVVWLISACQNI